MHCNRVGMFAVVALCTTVLAGCGTSPAATPSSTPSVDAGQSLAHRACAEFQSYQHAGVAAFYDATISSARAMVSAIKTLADAATTRSSKWSQLSSDADLFASFYDTFLNTTGVSQGGVDLLQQINTQKAALTSDCAGV